MRRRRVIANDSTSEQHTSFPDVVYRPQRHRNTVSQPAIKTTNPFFAALGTNTRTCASCHDVAFGWSFTPT